jgi:hypothetical protein
MIAKGTTHNNGVKLAKYITTGKDGERAELYKLEGFAAPDIKQAFRCVHVMAEATKCEQPFFHVQVRNREGEQLTRQQWEMTAHRIMRINGLTGQPYAIAFHINEITGEEHMHLAVSRIDAETLKAKPLPFFKERLNKISRELEKEFGLEAVKNQREGPIKYAPKRDEFEQARRLGVDIHDIRNTIRGCWDHCANGRDFQAMLEYEGLILAKGDRRGLVVIDHAGGIHALGKRILDMTPGQINARLSDLARDELPSVAEARGFVNELRPEKQQEKAAPVWDRERDNDAWLDAVMNAAIDREKINKQFVEPRDREKEKEARAAAQQPENLRGAAAQAWTAHCQSDNAKAFAAALDDKGLAFAITGRDEADRSRREAEFARAIGNYAPRFKEGEIVIVTEPRLEYRREGQIIEPPRVHKLDQSLADTFVNKLDNRNRLQGIDATLKVLDDRAQRRRDKIASARLERATDINASISAGRSEAPAAAAARTIGKGIGKGIEFADKTIRAAPAIRIGKAAASTISKPLEALARGFEDLFAPTLTPEQKHEGEKAQHRREAEADHSLDYSRLTAEQTQQRQQQENDREAARQRERDGGGRER